VITYVNVKVRNKHDGYVRGSDTMVLCGGKQGACGINQQQQQLQPELA
jgi:hypothetical protein